MLFIIGKLIHKIHICNDLYTYYVIFFNYFIHHYFKYLLYYIIINLFYSLSIDVTFQIIDIIV